MPEYLDLDLDADPERLRDDAQEWLLAQAPPGYVIDPLTDWILSAVARLAVEIIVLTGQVPLSIFQRFGTEVLRIPALTATSATGTVTVTAVNSTADRILEAGAQIIVGDIGFVTQADLLITTGNLAGQAAIVAIDPGANGSGIPPGPAELESPTYTWVESVQLVTLTTGGVDGETGQEYADRLADEVPTLSAKAILIKDFEVLARRDLEVWRALAIDNYDPGPPAATNVPGAVTIAVQSVSGEPVSTAAKTRVTSDLEAGRVLALAVYVINATYTNINVAFVGQSHAGYDPAAVNAEGQAALRDFLHPAVYGRPSGAAATEWINEPTIRINDLMGVLYRVPGIRHVNGITIGPVGGALTATDFTLTGPAGLPNLIAVTGTVTA
ncbi:MAG: baseplate J/gp47 family protein [Solirubrobacteraceae bacterium]